MANTFTLIASYTVGSGGAASIDFSSIPATYTDLCVKTSLRCSTADNIYIKLNNSSASFNVKFLYGSGSAAASGGQADAYVGTANASTYTANSFGSAELYIPNYAGSTNKSISSDSVQETNATTAYAVLAASLWSNTAAINQVTLSPNGGVFVEHSTAYLYGVSNA